MTSKYRLLHLGVNFRKKSPTSGEIDEIQEVLNKARDWYRYAPNCWLIYTSQPPAVWKNRLREVPCMAEVLMLIAPIDLSERSGWLTKDTWDWIKKHLIDVEL